MRLLVLCAAVSVLSPLREVAPPAAAPVETRVLSVPQLVTGSDGHRHLGYEIVVTSYDARTPALRLEAIDVTADPGGWALARFEGTDLAGRFVHPGGAPAGSDARAVQGGGHALMYVWLTLPDGRPPPVRVRHVLRFRSDDGAEMTVDRFTVDVDSRPVVALLPPFAAGTWLAHEGPGDHRSHHWGSQLAHNGRLTVPQRFAIDFIGLDASGRAVRGDVRAAPNADWVGFGAPVLAVADGVIRDARDGIADNPPLVPPARPASVTARGLYGNYVVIETAPHTFVHLAHLQQGSVRVAVGDRVRRGQMIGRVGNSGNTNGPHLHLHVSDRPTFEESNGLPFTLAALEILGQSTVDRAFGETAGGEATPTAVRRLPHVLPLNGTVIRVGRGGPDHDSAIDDHRRRR